MCVNGELTYGLRSRDRDRERCMPSSAACIPRRSCDSGNVCESAQIRRMVTATMMIYWLMMMMMMMSCVSIMTADDLVKQSQNYTNTRVHPPLMTWR